MPSESRIDSSSNSIAGGRAGRLPVAITIAPASTTWRRPSAAVIATVFASTKLAAAVEDGHVVARELVADDVGLAQADAGRARAQVLHRDVVLDAMALPVDRRAG